MKIIICGAGRLGFNLAQYLSRDHNEITLIDHDPVKIRRATKSIDLNGIVADAANPATLEKAGIRDVNMVIAVTHMDEINMVICQIAHSLFNVPKKVARIRKNELLNPKWQNLFSRDHMPIDLISSPEDEVAEAIIDIVSIHGAVDVFPVMEGKARVMGLQCRKDCPIINTPVSQLSEMFARHKMSILALYRGGEFSAVHSWEQFTPGDLIYFTCRNEDIEAVLSIFGFESEQQDKSNFVIVGGGAIGVSIATKLHEIGIKDRQIKIIEQDPDKAREISDQLKNMTVFKGDGLDLSVMQDAGVNKDTILIAVTNDDENNILGSLLARHRGAKRILTLINKALYMPLLSSLNLDALISPQTITASSIIKQVRRGKVHAIYPLRDGSGEVMEVEVSANCDICDARISDLDLPDNVVVAALYRNQEFLVANHDTVVKNKDHVVLFTTANCNKEVNKIFSNIINILEE